jgi:transcriptional regulator with XRE-family HTH domain
MPKSEVKLEVGRRVPSFRSEVGSRLREVEKSFKNRATVAAVCDVSKSTFQNWIEGRADPSFEGLARLSAATGISLDWLATGRGGKDVGTTAPAAVDEDLLCEVIEAVEAVLEERHLTLVPAKKALLLADLYMMILEEEGMEASAKGDLIKRMVRLAS